MKKIMKRLSAFLSILLFFISVPVLAKAADNAVITVAVEKFTLGQGYVVQPQNMRITEGETYDKVLVRFMQNNNMELISSSSGGFYLAGIKNADSGNSVLPLCVEELDPDQLSADKFSPANEKNESFPDLKEFSYTRQSGWMYCVNNYFPEVGMNFYKAYDGDVLRVRYTLYGLGKDIGSSFLSGEDALVLPDLDTITSYLSDLSEILQTEDSPEKQAVYDTALIAVSNMDYSQAVIAAAEEVLYAAVEDQNIGEAFTRLKTIMQEEDAQIAAKRNGGNDPGDEPGDDPDPDDEKKITITEAQTSAIPNQSYTGKAIQPKVTVTLNGATLKKDVDYTLAYVNNTKVGTATVTVTGIGGYEGTISRTFKIVKATPKVTAASKTVKLKAVKKKAVSVKALTVKNAYSKVSYKKTKGSKYLSVAKTGKIKVKKGTPRGTYSITVKVTVKSSSCNTKKTVTKKIKIKVK